MSQPSAETAAGESTRRIAEIVAGDRPTLSCEFFPPRTPHAHARIHRIVSTLCPDFATVTYGAGGSTRDSTFETALQLDALLPCAHHLTVLRHTAEELERIVDGIRNAGIANIVAVRGDPPRGERRFPHTPGGLGHADALVTLIRRVAPDTSIIVAGYPEGHQEARSAEQDVRMLLRKQEAGADVVFTQLFYENSAFYRWRDRCRRIGVTLPIVPGLMAVSSPRQLRKIALLCGASLPAALIGALERWEADPDARARTGAGWAIRQVEDLLAHGVPGIHIYCLNDPHPAIEVGRAMSRLAGREAGSRRDVPIQPAAFVADCTVLWRSMVMVIGPTPPGTGVMARAFLATSSNFTSPTRR